MAEALRRQLATVMANVERAQQIGPPIWPLNEADTERLIIEPVLRALGYGELDYRKRVQGVGANFPDYIVLPGSEQSWVLEAKEWDARLEGRFERQAVNYASNNGAQWAVLTNGRVWWIYNTRAAGDLNQQRVYEISDLSDFDAAVAVLPYLSRRSMQGGELEKAYRLREIRTALIAELRGRNRRVVNALRTVVGHALDRNVSNDDIAAALESVLAPGDAGITTPEPSGQADVLAPADEWIPLSALASDPELCTGRSPRCVRYSGAEPREVRTWRDVVVFALEDAKDLDRLGMPLKTNRGKRYFISDKPHHEDLAPMTAYREIHVDEKTVFVDVHRSARDLLKSLAVALSAVGADPDTLMVRVSLPE